jgi:hypothetical protein
MYLLTVSRPSCVVYMVYNGASFVFFVCTYVFADWEEGCHAERRHNK